MTVNRKDSSKSSELNTNASQACVLINSVHRGGGTQACVTSVRSSEVDKIFYQDYFMWQNKS